MLAPLGVQVARFGKRAAEVEGSAGANSGKKASWFVVHRAVQILVVVLSAVGILMIVIAIDDSELPHFDSTHSALGTVTASLMCIQLLFGIVRPAKDSPLRHAWQLAHKCCGYITWVLAMITCILGALKLPDVLSLHSAGRSDGDSIWIVVLVVGLLGFGSLAFLEVFTRVQMSKQTRADGVMGS